MPEKTQNTDLPRNNRNSGESAKSHIAIIGTLIGLIPVFAGGAYQYGVRLGTLEAQVQEREIRDRLTKSESKNIILDEKLQSAKSELSQLTSYYNDARVIIERSNAEILRLRAEAEKNNNCVLIHNEIKSAQANLDYLMKVNFNGQYQAEINSLQDRIKGFQSHLGTCGGQSAAR